MPLGQAG